MKKRLLAAMMVLVILMLSGCGDGGNTPPVFVAQIVSDQAIDGDILNSSGVFTVTQGMTPTVQSVFAGINPVTGAEYRAFLHFPLTGSIPGNAIIVSAFLDIVIDSILPQPLFGTIPIRVDLVSFQPPILVSTDFDRILLPALASITLTPPISQTDLRNHVSIDVTLLMEEAQRLGLANFQVRIMEDLGIVTPGRIEINDTTGVDRAIFAPLLQVTYF